MPIVGIHSLHAKAIAQAIYAGAANQTDVNVLADNTFSMGLAATTADINKMQKLAGGCAFAFHSMHKPGTDNYALA